MNKWLSDEEIDLLRDDIRHKNCQTCQDEQKVSDQAKDANRLREGLEVLHKDVEAMGLGLLYLRISELLEGIEGIGPEGFPTWKDAAIAERTRRAKICSGIRQLIAELRERPWHQTPEQVAERLEGMLNE